jgi:hypothetical protein
VRAEFHDPDDPETVLGVARWDSGTVRVEAAENGVREGIGRVFRPSPVVVDEPALRPLSSHGEALVHPGSLEWFRVAALTRAAEEGLRARIVPEVQGQGGWDPASAYRTFRQTVAHLVTRAHAEGEAPEQPGETRPEGGPG